MERKSDTVRRLVAAGDFKAALRIAKDFRLGISKEDSDDMRRGYECMIHGAFYQSIGPLGNCAKGRGDCAKALRHITPPPEN